VERVTDSGLAGALERGRERFNMRFAYARRMRRRLDPAEFGRCLVRYVEPAVAQAGRLAPEQTDAVTEALYDLALELVGLECLGASSRYPLINAAWQDLLPRLAQFLVQDPWRLTAAVSNAVYNLSREPSARTALWLTRMATLSARCASLDQLLTLGQVLAWTCGLAHFRESALLKWQELPEDLALVALGITPLSGTTKRDLASVLADPWRQPTQVASHKPSLALVGRVGGFRGFGGPFVSPPRAISDGRTIYLCDRESCWALFADCFGATLQRLGPAPSSASPSGTNYFGLTAAGVVTRGVASAKIPELARSSSFAATATTLAVTLPVSHMVQLVAQA